jgi:hypothetical protein
MKPSVPPALATWLLSRLLTGEKSESLIGDLMEQYQRGRSRVWYWRQTVSALGLNAVAATSTHKWLAMTVLTLGVCLPYVYMSIPGWVFVTLDGWYPRLINWLLKEDLNAIRQVTYRLHLWGLTATIVCCSMIAGVTWIMTVLNPRQRALITTLLLITNVGPCLPYWRGSLADWIREPANPIWFFNFFWFSTYTFIAIPVSLILGGRYGSRFATVLREPN